MTESVSREGYIDRGDQSVTARFDKANQGNSMRLIIAGLAPMVFAAAAGAADDLARPVKTVPRNAAFHAYWATKKEQERSGYQTLLVTHGPVEDLAGHNAWSTLPLDNVAMTFTTYARDSFWAAIFTPVQKIGAVDAVAKSVELDGTIYRYEPCPIEQVVKMTKNPMGTVPAHRRANPIRGAETTMKAFRLLLEEQLRGEQATK